jgi:hypothetical protein
VDSKNIVCHVNSSACRVYVTSFYSTTSISFYKSFYTFTVFMYFLQLHFRGHFCVHFCTSTPTFICGCPAMSLFYTYTHLWMYSGLYNATATFSRPFSCTFLYIHAYIHLWTHSDVYILHLCSSVDVHAVSTVLQLHFRGHFRVHFRTSTPTFICGRTSLCSLHSSLQRPITCLVFKVAKSAWLHFTHQTEISLFTTFYTYI